MPIEAATPQARAQMHDMWHAVAGGWAAHADFVDRRGADLTQAMLDRVRPGSGLRVLELASGPGGPGLAAAQLVGPDGVVVLSDVAPGMVEIAAGRAAARGLTNVTTRVLDLEEIAEPDASYDIVLCRDGLQFSSEPARAVAEIHRVLRPGGRVALATWGPRESNPWLGVVLDVVSAQLGKPMPPPGVRGPFSLDDATALAGLLTSAGLAEVTVSAVAVPMHTATVDEWWARTTALAGPLAQVLASLPDELSRALRARAGEAVRPYETSDGLDFPGVALLAGGERR
jgi:SAM-dependent methyltransferase